MKKKLVLVAILLMLSSTVFAIDFGVNYSKELKGFQRDFFGVTIRSVGEGFIGFDLMVITPQLSNMGSPFENAKYLFQHFEDVEYAQILPFLLFNLNLKPLALYGGIAPMIDFEYDKVAAGETRTPKLSLYSPFLYQVKAGAQLNLFFLGVYAEAGTIIDLTFQSAFENYHFTLGAVLNF